MTFDELWRRVWYRLRGRVVTIPPQGKPRGRVLISYTALPYLDRRQTTLDAHTNRWECMEIVRAFTTRGYAVDIIESTNHTFKPKKSYTYFVDNMSNMDRLAPLLNKGCVKVLHITAAHWRYQNEAEKQRLANIQKRRGFTLPTERQLPPDRAIELCDCATMLGNDFTEGTYTFAGKPITRIPISTTHTYQSPEHKNFEDVRKKFIWLGGAGLAHKGLDLVLETFAAMPEYHLTVCGKIRQSDLFVQAYRKELFETPNITVAGWINPGSDTFKTICNESLGIIYPSCSEGQAGGVVLTMHAGLIPVVTNTVGVDVDNFGVTVSGDTPTAVQDTIRTLSNESHQALRERAVSAWEYARAHHTKETFSRAYNAFVDMLEKKYNK